MTPSSLPRGLPHLHFFRHRKRKGVKICKAGRFGKDYLYKWWKVACRNLGIEGVDLYGGTRHSSARALREYYSPEQIKKATMHSTNIAFERYFRVELNDVRNIYQKAATKQEGNGRILELKRTKSVHENKSLVQNEDAKRE